MLRAFYTANFVTSNRHKKEYLRCKMLSFGSQQEGDDLNNLNAVACVVETGAFFVFFMS